MARKSTCKEPFERVKLEVRRGENRPSQYSSSGDQETATLLILSGMV